MLRRAKTCAHTALVVALISCSGQGSGSQTAVEQGVLPAIGSPVAHARSAARRASGSMTTDWDSFGFDLQRTNYNPYESTVGVNNVASLQEVWSFSVGRYTVWEPIYAYGVSVGGNSTNILYSGSSDGATMYALNAQTGAVIWQRKVAKRHITCRRGTVPFSIQETPAIDRTKNLIYFSDGRDKVHAADLATGAEATGWPLRVADSRHNNMHGGFTYNPANALLYAVTSSHCDESPWYGRIVAIDTDRKRPKIVGTFFTMSGNDTQGSSGGGIWGPGGASIDPATNNVFVATGNADGTVGQQQNAPYAEEVIELSPLLDTVLGNNYPANIPQEKHYFDFDFGATPLLFQPPGCPPLVAAVNKSGMFELYDRASISSGPIQYIPMSVPSGTGSFIGVPTYDPVTNYVYVGLPDNEGIYQPGMAAFSIAYNCTLNPTPVWSAQFGPVGSQDVTSRRSAISIANGVAYISDYTGDTEYAFDAANGTQLWTLALPTQSDEGTVIANGMVYVSSSNGAISAWALPGMAEKLRKKAVKRPPGRSDQVLIPDRFGGMIDLGGPLPRY
ncbi:MAG: PQQ-binding-like beta-propeller repeat protein [Candidatus Eremiobacteraeota bacterium]|nr:PQQ-binding-like beta-propeller repeat protein [Candidatus Eremiobacteraeota bacterium]